MKDILIVWRSMSAAERRGALLLSIAAPAAIWIAIVAAFAVLG